MYYLNNPKKLIAYSIIFIIGYFLGDKTIQNFSLDNLKITLSPSNQTPSSLPLDKGRDLIATSTKYIVNYVVDGDTIHVKNENGVETKVRLLAVNTLELHATSSREKCLAEQEKQFTKQNLLGKEVVLTADPTQPKLDKYGRSLFYISLTPPRNDGKGTLEAKQEGEEQTFNELLMKTGNAKIYKSSPPAQMYTKYLDLQNQAIQSRVGIWDPTNCKL